MLTISIHIWPSIALHSNVLAGRGLVANKASGCVSRTMSKQAINVLSGHQLVKQEILPT